MSMTRKDMFTYILDELESYDDIKFSTNPKVKLTYNTLLNALVQTKDPVWKAVGYTSSAGLCIAMRKVLSVDMYSYKRGNEQWTTFLPWMFEMKYCPKCDLCHPLDNFSNDGSQGDGLCTYCKECNIETRDIRRNKNKEFLVSLMIREGTISGPVCQECGNPYKTSDHIHHKDPYLERPDFALYSEPAHYLGASVSLELLEERFLQEKDNLTLVCLPCHQAIHRRLEKEER